eukprot:RCo015243
MITSTISAVVAEVVSSYACPTTEEDASYTVKGIVERSLDEVVERITDAEKMSRQLHDGIDATIIGGLKMDCLDILYRLLGEIPDVDVDVAGYGVTSDVEKLKEQISMLKQKLMDYKGIIVERDTMIDLLRGKLLRREKAISYVRENLYREVCLLRERLLSGIPGDVPGAPQELELFSIMDFLKIADLVPLSTCSVI